MINISDEFHIIISVLINIDNNVYRIFKTQYLMLHCSEGHVLLQKGTFVINSYLSFYTWAATLMNDYSECGVQTRFQHFHEQKIKWLSTEYLNNMPFSIIICFKPWKCYGFTILNFLMNFHSSVHACFSASSETCYLPPTCAYIHCLVYVNVRL